MSNRICFEGELDLKNLTLFDSFSAKDFYIEELLKMGYMGTDFALVFADSGGPVEMYTPVVGKRVVDAGIAECDAIGIATGIALSGRKTFVQFFGVFAAERALDQVINDVALNNVPVRIMATHGGLTSASGPTHYNVMDLAIMRSIPNLTVVVPADANQCVKVVQESFKIDGPMYIRIARGAEPLAYTTQDYDFQIGKAVTTLDGSDITIIATGTGVPMAVSAANGMAKEGVSVRVLDMHTIRPFDREAVLKAARETGRIITVEDHFTVGGLGGAVAEVLASEGIGIPFKMLGVPNDEFTTVGEVYELYAHYKFNPAGIKDAIREVMAK